ncbi:putative protein phosphatase 1 regulatory subunit 37 [Monocercomonoides exilis]|uniref:putative protein phosphatase 1 regulatory subunit 37 n=1 Tax=Monocercomonoides exilis TaxID=2049356 RepID=UPI003559404C|nr:putative protein phosphatase 1 regulatory subunit 37 [Monocercomonoides exilis]|eukprot:MONOS_5796.1-p1 / transcript=MONOS_5796.1 / gene=MONOS_5796 / organism=Monocercomonoides_exilis_PA203 / gene_product=unspecified product / transcript_product=unspecified product / location=Mono_scaffold00173:91861-93999(+) / protein_length=484 / sequence_SO=supercontig / SO=protein_coding / is_pseudo=false
MIDTGTQTTFDIASNSIRQYKSECMRRNVQPEASIVNALTNASKKEEPLYQIVVRDTLLSRAQCEAISTLIPASSKLFIRVLDFEGSLKEDTVEVILESARQAPTLDVLNLKNCKVLSLKSCTLISEMIKNGFPMRVLDISNNQVDVNGLQLIGKSLTSPCCHLEILKMNCLTPSSSVLASMQLISKSLSSNTTVLSLGVGENHLTSQSTEHMTMFLKDTIPLPPITPRDESPTQIEKEKEEKEKLSSEENEIEKSENKSSSIKAEREADESVAQISPIKITSAIIYTSQLASLDLRQNNIGDEGALKISTCLKTNRTLLSLVLWATHLSPVGIGYLCNGLSDNSTLQHFDIGCNIVGFEGCKHLGVLLKSNFTLTTIGIASSEICSDDLIHICQALVSNWALLRIDLRRNPRLSYKGIQQLKTVMEANTTIQCIFMDTQQLIEKCKEGSEKHLLQADLQYIQQSCERNISSFIKANSIPENE